MRSTPERTALRSALLAALLVGGAAQADLYRWTDANGEEHFSNLPGDAPPGTIVDRVPSGPVTPTAPGAPRAPSQKAAPGPGRGDEPAIAPADLDIERYALEEQIRRTRDRQREVDDQLRALGAASTTAPNFGEGAVQAFVQRSEREVALQMQRDDVTKQLDALRAQYADLRRRAAEANDGVLPHGWAAEVD